MQYPINCDEIRTGYPLEQDQDFTDKHAHIEVYITNTDKLMAKVRENWMCLAQYVGHVTNKISNSLQTERKKNLN